MRNYLLLALFLGVAWGCGKNPENKALELLKAGDRVGATALLEAAKALKPEQLSTRSLLFVIYQFQVSQGDPAKHENFLQLAISEYSFIAQQTGMTPDYQNMDASLKSGEKTKAAYDAAYAAVYAR